MTKKILIINSCGKAKLITHKDQPLCSDLVTEEQRKAAIERFSSILVPARDLYVGGQAKAVAEAVKILKKKAQVDYYIVSAGFGLVREDEKLPPYECTFSGLGKAAIQQRAKELKIEESLAAIPRKNYDIVYLSLGQDYLTALGDLKNLSDLGKEIVYFGKQIKGLPSNFHAFDSTLFIGQGENIFQISIGAAIKAKGTILQNFAIEYEENLEFSNWWVKKKEQLENQNSQNNAPRLNISQNSFLGAKIVDSITPRDNYKYEKKVYTRSGDYMVSLESSKYISEILDKKINDKDLKDLAESCKGLRTINTRSEESRREYIE
ncbi:MAG: DUF6884 domain-containing protein, partial [Candidatus Heimdallarchaeaceae archaeon]